MLLYFLLIKLLVQLRSYWNGKIAAPV
jgi:hypothetical protein